MNIISSSLLLALVSLACAVDPVQLLVPVDSTGSIAYTDTFTARPGGANNAVDAIDGVAVQLSLGSTFTFMFAEDVPENSRVLFRFFVGDLDGPSNSGMTLTLTDHEGATIYNYIYFSYQCGSVDVGLDMTGFNTTSLTLSIVDYSSTQVRKGIGFQALSEGYLSLSMGYKVYEVNQRADNGVFYLELSDASPYFVASSSVDFGQKQPLATSEINSNQLVDGEWMQIGGSLEINVTEVIAGMSQPMMQLEFFARAPNNEVFAQIYDSTGHMLDSMMSESSSPTPTIMFADVPLNPNASVITIYADYDPFMLSQFAEVYDLDEANMYESRVPVTSFTSSDPDLDTYADVVDNAPNCTNDIFADNIDELKLFYGELLSMCTTLDDVANYFPIPSMVGDYGNTIVEWTAFPRSLGASTPTYVFLATEAQKMGPDNVATLMASDAMMILSNVTYTGQVEESGAQQTNRPVRMIANLGHVDVDMYPYLVIGQLGDPLAHFLGTAIRFYNAPEFSHSSTMTPSQTPSSAVSPTSSLSVGATPSITPSQAATPSQTQTIDASSSIAIAPTLALFAAALVSLFFTL